MHIGHIESVQIQQLAQVPQLRRDRSAQQVGVQIPTPTRVSTHTIVHTGRIGMNRLTDSAAGPGSPARAGSFRATGWCPNPYSDESEKIQPMRTLIRSGRSNLQPQQLAQVAEIRRDRSAQLVPGQVPIPPRMSKSNYRAHGSYLGSLTYSHCSWLRLPSSGGIVPLNWFKDRFLLQWDKLNGVRKGSGGRK